MTHYVNSTNEKPGRFYGQYLLGDTMELTDGSIWEYHPEVGWFPTRIGTVVLTTDPLTGVSGISIDSQFVPIAPGPDNESVSFLGTNGRSITINTAHVPDNTDLQILGPLNLLQESTSLTYNATTTPTTPTGSTGLTITEPGTYILSAKVKTTLVGTTWAAAANAGALLHRTNNTPADLTNSGTTAMIPAMTTLTITGPTILPGETVYTTSNSNDVINVKAFVGTLPSVGALQVTSTHIMAKRVTM